MCVYSETVQHYTKCTYPDGEDHNLPIRRKIENIQPNMSQDVINKLSCVKDKGSDGLCAEATQWPSNLGSTKLKGRCPICEAKRYYPDSDNAV